ncbi:MAG: CPBP family intramembrane metalloprotease [Bacteroidales bacterium]|nr:CPBP family intramembrane metalloprotease [Bacteroidales bacterium]
MALFARKVNSYDLYSGHAWYVPGVKGMFGFIGWFILGSLLGGMVMLVMGLFMSPQAVQDYSMVVVYPVQFLPAMVYAANQSRKNMMFDPGYVLDNRHSAPYSFGLLVLITVVMTLASMFAFDLPNYWNMQLTNRSSLLSRFYDVIMETMKQMTGGPFWSSFLVVAIFAPIFEEWLCRGMVLRGLLTKMKPVWAIVVSAVFFAVIHGNPWQALNAFLLGMVMGYVYFKTGSLILTMIIHFVNNGTAVIASNIEAFKDLEDLYWIEILGKQNYTIVFLVSCVILAACLWVFSRIKLENPWGNIDRIPPADEMVAPAEKPAPSEEPVSTEE